MAIQRCNACRTMVTQGAYEDAYLVVTGHHPRCSDFRQQINSNDLLEALVKRVGQLEWRAGREDGDVCDAFKMWAHEAVDDWPGDGNGELLKLLAERFGVPLAELVRTGQAIVDAEAAEYNGAADTLTEA